MNVPNLRPIASFCGDHSARHAGDSRSFGGRIKHGELAR